MDEIVYIEFGKSRSVKFKKALAFSKCIDGFVEKDGVISVSVLSIREYLEKREYITEIIDIVRGWKSSIILLYGKKYISTLDYSEFLDQVEKQSGKYIPIVKSRDTVAINAISIEQLPLPFVFYPNLYGTFLAFANDIDGKLFFCECERPAIENFLKLKQMEGNDFSIGNLKKIFERDFPSTFFERLDEQADCIEHLFHYKEGLCFRCNKSIPKKAYCHPMYGGQFKQHYGWYINQEYYRLGIDKKQYQRISVLPDACTPEIYDTIQRINSLLEEQKTFNENVSEIIELRNSVDHAIENAVREQLGVKKIGDAWVSETILFGIIEGLYPGEETIRHFRPKWLDGLEIDIYLPSKKLGFEYQGIQHFKAVDHWGGKAQLAKQQEHDARKKKICDELGINLVCINYDEPLTTEFVASKIECICP